MMVLKAFWDSLEVTFGALGGRLGSPLGGLGGLMAVSWDPFGDLRSTKKFVFELVMASVDLDVLFVFSCLLFCSCYFSSGIDIFLNVQDLLTFSKLLSLDVLTSVRRQLRFSFKCKILQGLYGLFRALRDCRVPSSREYHASSASAPSCIMSPSSISSSSFSS